MPTSGHTRIGRYELRKRLGVGGMGTVWHAWDPALRRDVAVKEVLLPDNMTPQERAEAHVRTLREAQATARISHSSVVTVHDVLEHESSPWIVMELLDGTSFQHRLDTVGPMRVERVEQAARSLLGGLRAAHAAGVAHRDVKPANIMSTSDNRTMLTDFGIANVDGSTALTQTGVYIGSPEYMAPERFEGARALPASDLWSLGVTLYALLEGRSPFKRDSVTGMISAVLTDPMPPQLTRNQDARAPEGAALRALIAALLTRDVAARPDPRAALELLERERQAAQHDVATRRAPLPGNGPPRPQPLSGPQQPRPPGGPGQAPTGVPRVPGVPRRPPNGPQQPQPPSGPQQPQPPGVPQRLVYPQAAPPGPTGPVAGPVPGPTGRFTGPAPGQTGGFAGPVSGRNGASSPVSGGPFPGGPVPGRAVPANAGLRFLHGVGHTGPRPGTAAAPGRGHPARPDTAKPAPLLTAMVMLGLNALALFVFTALAADRANGDGSGTGWGSVVFLGLWGVVSAFAAFGLLTRSRLVYALVVIVQGIASASLAMSMFTVFVYTPELMVPYALMLLYTLAVGGLLLVPASSRAYFGLG
ncbi:hypothetical protein GCM10007079_42310 [Nocardiopsis terrae]|uniref:non-specific serine/threonine protein kinase n=1 Tax=Nocardiopsis terrae TaxID=372655 RepID=A0ABR9HLQ2_9ACTN|nr:serine/threonine-protein kinase [Nocardiopsis terrae]MBE1459952.1 serine/threonine protein kinase [Nocardiopsis terrae]GHC93176.1 hypothetical protein GCM10007079_42310 [Nocardiopsis terrae]